MYCKSCKNKLKYLRVQSIKKVKKHCVGDYLYLLSDKSTVLEIILKPIDSAVTKNWKNKD